MASEHTVSRKEVWKPVVGWEGLYEVSNNGRVRSTRKTTNSFVGRILVATPKNNGYLHVGLCRNNRVTSRHVHKLVFEAFIGPIPDELEINHRNTDKNDNRPENFELLTHAENMRHARENGLMQRGADRWNSKLTEKDILEIRSLYGSMSREEIGKRFGITKSHVWSVATNKVWKHVA